MPMPNKTIINLRATIPENLADKRLDIVLSSLFPEHSRSRLQNWIKAGFVKLDGSTVTSKEKCLLVSANQNIEINATIEPQNETHVAQKLTNMLNIVYEDDDIIIINKPVGLVVHPGAGNSDKTLLNALLFHAPELKNIPRAGIVHRLDKDTSGLLVVARTLEAHTKLIDELQERLVKREYEAIIVGVLTAGGTVNAPIGRHHIKRKAMAVKDDGKVAITHYRVIERFQAHTHIKVMLDTGRTHQIRVHMAHINHPIVGDPIYGGRLKLPKGASEELITLLRTFKRQALHARRLGLNHPRTGKYLEWEASLPNDMVQLLHLLKNS